MPNSTVTFHDLFSAKPVIGTIHLKALPGSPSYDGNMRQVLDSAMADAEAYIQGGCDALIVENFFDAPFFKDQVGAETVAAMSKVATLLREKTKLPLGINVLRNDGNSAIAIATACDCQFIRVNVLSWAMLTDQGIIEGKSAQILRYRSLLKSNALIFADCLVKHAFPLTPMEMELIAEDTWERGGADALIISGTGTGKATDVDDVLKARKGAPEAPILIGSGTTAENLDTFMAADGFIVGTYFKVNGKLENPVDPGRVEHFIQRRGELLG